MSTHIHSSLEKTLLRFSTAGSVDDGKSTLIGRLLYDTENVYDDHLAALKKSSTKEGGGEALSLALLTDGLKAEREQNITIDVAYRYFSTEKRRFILADAPGHEQYTRNMATAASTAQLTIILVDAQKGIQVQTRRHAFIASLMGVPRLLIAINKMDLVGFSQERFEEVKREFLQFSPRLGIKDLRFIPVSARDGDNIVTQSTRMPWHHGETVMEYLENIYVDGDTNLVDFRFPVQYVIRPNPQYRGYAGQISSGIVRKGDEVVVLPSMRRSKVKSIDIFDQGKIRSLAEAKPPMSVAITLEDQIDISRGNMLAKPKNLPEIKNHFEALLVWMSDKGMETGKPYIIRHTTTEAKTFVDSVQYKIDVNTLGRSPGGPLGLNEIGRASLTTTHSLFLDPYERNRATGNFILIHPDTFHTVAAGMIIDRSSDESEKTSVHKNLHAEESLITRQDREVQSGASAVTVWMTGLSGAGKSTIARALERKLFESRRPIYRLDGDNLRHGLNKDLGFSQKDRSENIRRVAEVAKLFNDAGVSVVCAFISPFERDRLKAREIVGSANFVEVYLNTPIQVCETRDPHGLYKKARAGEISDFTGINSPYEPPKNAEITVDTGRVTSPEAVDMIAKYLEKRKSN